MLSALTETALARKFKQSKGFKRNYTFGRGAVWGNFSETTLRGAYYIRETAAL